jgi:hypothetical protein
MLADKTHLAYTYLLIIQLASLTKWAIKYEEPAGQVFVQNHPQAAVFVENCNVILKYAKPIFPFGCTKHITPVYPTQL